jgi:TonB family protein
MKKEVLISLSIHVGAVFIFLLPSMLKVDKTYPMGEVYSVRIVSRPTTYVIERPRKTKEKKKEEKKLKKAKESEAEGAMGRVQTDANFKYSYYLSTIISRIGRNWRNPYRGEEISAVVHFFITRDGSIEEVKLHKSSGNYLFDQSVIRAVNITKSLPPLPPEYKEKRLGVFFEFAYTP